MEESNSVLKYFKGIENMNILSFQRSMLIWLAFICGVKGEMSIMNVT